MRKLAILVALASTTALATPAVAKNNSFYLGIDAGGMVVEDLRTRVNDGVTDPLYKIDHKIGYDLDALAGYDFGRFRAEAELSYKHAKVDSVTTTSDQVPADGRTSAFSGMINGLIDFGDEDHLYGFAGAGVGIANVRYSVRALDVPPFGPVDISDSDSHFAWQLLLGARWAVSQNFDVGVKYRYFDVPKLRYTGDFGTTFTPLDTRTHWKS